MYTPPPPHILYILYIHMHIHIHIHKQHTHVCVTAVYTRTHTNIQKTISLCAVRCVCLIGSCLGAICSKLKRWTASVCKLGFRADKTSSAQHSQISPLGHTHTPFCISITCIRRCVCVCVRMHIRPNSAKLRL